LVVKSLGETLPACARVLPGVSMLGDSDIIFIVDLEEIVANEQGHADITIITALRIGCKLRKNSDRRTESEN
jgi:chemotaxis protein histidine kinase CheA